MTVRQKFTFQFQFASQIKLWSKNKQSMNEEERLKLAAKLDNDLDDFINSLERKPYTDGWSPETWQKVSKF